MLRKLRPAAAESQAPHRTQKAVSQSPTASHFILPHFFSPSFLSKRHPCQCCVSLLLTTAGSSPVLGILGPVPAPRPLANEKFGGIFKIPNPPSLRLAKSEGRCCPRGPGVTYSTHLHSASETSGDPVGSLLLRGWRADAIPYGRVSAEIVCDDTLVQYAAYCALVFFSSFWEEGG